MARTILTDFDFSNSARVRGLQDPALAQDAATKAYVDSAIEGISWKDSVRVASTANVNTASPGATIDGITMATNDRVLLKDQTTQSQNGIYIWNGAATPMTRAPDMSIAAEFEQAVVVIEEGTSAGASFRQTAVNITLDTTSVTWSTFLAGSPAASETTPGIAELATQAETDAGTDDARIVTPLKLKNWSSAPKRFLQSIGDGSATSYTITHNLNTRDVQVTVYRNSGAYDEVLTDVEHTTVNSITVKFNTPPAASAFRVVVNA